MYLYYLKTKEIMILELDSLLLRFSGVVFSLLDLCFLFFFRFIYLLFLFVDIPSFQSFYSYVYYVLLESVIFFFIQMGFLMREYF